MKTIKSFQDFTRIQESTMAEGSCMSETMIKKCNEMYEAMCEEMKACHADETEMTAENYRKECESKINEMYESISKACNEIMKEGSYNDSDGDMRQGSIQDVPVMAGAVR